MPDQVLAIDQGTYSTRAILFDSEGQVVCSAQQAVGLHRISRSEIEQSADEILQSMQAVVARILDHPSASRGNIRYAGLATQQRAPTRKPCRYR